jgi:CRISPR system Cascade subunit CasA
MNLIRDAWIPVVTDSPEPFCVSPVALLVGAHRNAALDSPRLEFRGAIYQFLIGLLQSTYAPQTLEDWAECWQTPPDSDELRRAFEPVADAFELFAESGPAFMQDLELPAKAREARIDSLLPTTPGENAVKLNKDLFTKGGLVDGLCESCTAAALFAKNLNGVAGGAGFRVGIRGGGPLTTLPLANQPPHGNWSTVWLSVLCADDGDVETSDQFGPEVFPWLGPTRESSGNKTTHPGDAHWLQAYWAMSQRARLDRPIDEGSCDLCGSHGRLFRTLRITNYGASYGSTWRHPLSPYRVQTEDDGSTAIIATKGKQGGFSYVDWLSLTIGANDSQHAAPVVEDVTTRKMFAAAEVRDMRLWCFGYDAENAKVRQWFDQTVPLLRLSPEKRVAFTQQVQILIDGANAAAFLLHRSVKEAWFDSPKDARGDSSHIRRAEFEATEREFYRVIDVVRAVIESESSDTNEKLQKARDQWRAVLVQTTQDLFDRFALQETDEVRNMSRIAKAAHSLQMALTAPNGYLRKTLGR